MRQCKNLFQNSVHVLRIVRRPPSQGWWCFRDGRRVHGFSSSQLGCRVHHAQRHAKPSCPVSLVIHYQFNVLHNRMSDIPIISSISL